MQKDIFVDDASSWAEKSCEQRLRWCIYYPLYNAFCVTWLW